MVSFTGFAKSYDRHCFREHITESIAINLKRKKAYKALTNGESDRIFTTLISTEVATVAVATYFDLKAHPYHKKNMDLFCYEFMSMKHSPEFDPDRRIYPEEKFLPFDWKFYQTRLESALRSKRVDQVRKISIESLLELKKYPHYYCMSRHLIESIYRIAYFVDIRKQQAEELGIEAPTDLLIDVLKTHLLGFSLSYKIDLWSHPIQEGGIPLLCSELPDLLHDLQADELKPLKREGL